MMDYRKLIPEGKSVRDYKKTEVKEPILKEIMDFGNNSEKLVGGINTQLLMKNKDEVFENLKNIAGYKGLMLEAPHYMIFLSEVKDYYIENTGYIVQNTILKATELGINSCWITFENSEKIKEKLKINSELEVTALIALGYNNNKVKIINTTKTGGNLSKADIRVVEDNRSTRLGAEEIVYMSQWGKNTDLDDLSQRGLLEGFNYARLAPSTLNRQPWRFIVDEDIVVLSVRNDEFTDTYEERIDAGIVMLYFEKVIDVTLFDMTWHMGEPIKEYKIPDEFKIVGYCNI